MSESIIHIENLVKYYSGRCVLNGIDLEVPRGCIYGLLGRNGVGKTTLIRILLGLEPPTRGRTLLLGEDSRQLSSAVKGRLGYVAEGHPLIQHYRVDRLIKLCRSLAQQWNGGFFDHLIKTFNLPKDRKVKELSTGMRAQLNLALAMATNPELLILDDPTLGLDTVTRRQFLELAVDLIQQEKRSIVFSSHILADVERIADRIGILVAGRLVVDCSLDTLKENVRKLRIIFPKQAPAALPLTDIIQQETRGREMVVTIANWNQDKQTMLEALAPSNWEPIPMSLEELFLACSGATSVTPPRSEEEVPPCS